MKKIKLTQNQIALVDDDDFEILNKVKWSAQWLNGKSFYAERSVPYNKTRRQKTVFMHRIIMNAPDGMVVDHINHDTLDNRKQNLRLCSVAENSQNRRLQKNNKSGYKGVSWSKKLKKWRAICYYTNKQGVKFQINLGYFKDVREAALVYNEKAKLLHGKFALLNPIV